MPDPRPIAPGLFRVDADGPRLLATRCAACDRLQFPAAASCPYCGEDGGREAAVGPDARLFLYTVIKSPPPGYRGPLPYGFGVVELPEGLRVVTRLTASDVTHLRVDQPMRLVVEPLFSDEDGTPVLSFAFGPCA